MSVSSPASPSSVSPRCVPVSRSGPCVPVIVFAQCAFGSVVVPAPAVAGTSAATSSTAMIEPLFIAPRQMRGALTASPSEPELLPDEPVHLAAVGAPLGLAHHEADDRAHGLLLAALQLL